MAAEDSIAAVREQGGLVGIPHPFDRLRGSLSKTARLDALAPLVDWVETHNARLVGSGNEQAGAFALEHGLPGVASSDAHSLLEVAVAYTAVEGDPSTAAGLLAALSDVEIVPGRASYLDPPVDPGGQGHPAPARQRPDPSGGAGMTDGQDHRPMDDGTRPDVPSPSMEATPAIDPRAGVRRPPPSATARPADDDRRRAGERDPDAAQMSLARRLRQPRTIISIAIPLFIIAAFVAINGEQLITFPQLILGANPVLILAAFAIFYAGFPMRGCAGRSSCVARA